MARVGFYHLERRGLTEILPTLLEKALAAGFRVKLLTPNEAETERLVQTLWVYGEGSFLPHGSAKDGWEAEQPIFVTDDRAANPNGATLLAQVGGAEADRLAGFERVLDPFDGRDAEALDAARARWRRYKDDGHTLEYHQEKPGGGWDRKL